MDTLGSTDTPTIPATTAGEQRITLPDGRTLAYREYGDPAGAPVVNCHGGLLSGLDVAPFTDVASALDALPDPGIAAAAAHGLEHGDGMVEEYVAWARPWGFTPEDVAVPAPATSSPTPTRPGCSRVS